MARENQGLQIALIFFVVLTIVFSVATFMFFQRYKEKAQVAEGLQSEKQKADEAKNMAQNECNKIKLMVGFAESDPLATISAEFQKDMQTYAGNFEEEHRVYRKVLQYLNDIVQKKSAALAAEQEEVKRHADALAKLEQAKQPQIDQAFQAQSQATNDLATRQAAFTKELNDTKENNEQLLADLQKSRKESQAATDLAQAKQKEADDQVRTISDQYHWTRDKLEKMITPAFETAHGQVRWVDQHNRTLWINLGRADGLKRQTTFSVYSSDANDVTKAGRKGSIEVTQILGEHMAEARIVEDQIPNPIMPGDVIHTPIWAPGQREHFALVGTLDIDGDGKSDRELLVNLIHANGAVVDAWVDDKGNRNGQMTTDTRYLVEGAAPDANASREMTNSFTEMRREADRLGIRKISLKDLLRRMGYKDENRVVRFGKGAAGKDFPARFPAGEVPRASGGQPSGLYLDKNPPRAVRGSAY